MTNTEKQIVDKVLDIAKVVNKDERAAAHIEIEKLLISQRKAETKKLSVAQPLVKSANKVTAPTRESTLY